MNSMASLKVCCEKKFSFWNSSFRFHDTFFLDALHKMEATANHINELVTEYENAESLLALTRRLSCSPANLVVPGRKIIKQGSLMKVLIFWR